MHNALKMWKIVLLILSNNSPFSEIFMFVLDSKGEHHQFTKKNFHSKYTLLVSGISLLDNAP